MSDLLDFHDIATQCNVSYDTVRRTIKKIGDDLSIEVQRKRNNKGTLSTCLSVEDANKLISYFESRKSTADFEGQECASRKFGYFYIIQLVPEALPNRVKLGYTEDLKQRLREHQTSAPTAQLIGQWRCKRYWEQTATDSITRESCKLVLNEVYEADTAELIHRAEEFFALMPSRSHKHTLSEYSPMKRKKKDA
jgi:hypothetical protein